MLSRLIRPAIPFVLIAAIGASWATEPPADGGRADRPAKETGGFADTRQGDVPEGSAELINSETERAIEESLVWLAKTQQSDGSFGGGIYRGNIAVTSLAALAFMANGSSPGRGPFGKEIERALGYVLDNTARTGFINVPNAASYGPMYSHGFGTLFLAEAYGMTHRPEIGEKLRDAVRLILGCQNNEGGWRYQPVPADADLSVTVCQINALRAARNAGIYVPKETVEKCIKYVKMSQNDDGGFRYQLSAGGGSAFPRSAAGVVALYSASIYDSKEVDRGVAYLRRHIPGRSSHMNLNNFYFYGHYYAAQAMWIRGGDDWTAWYPAIRDELLRRRSSRGVWNDGACDEYGTAMAAIILQIPYNHLPIFQR
jgi:hypothetical protein